MYNMLLIVLILNKIKGKKQYENGFLNNSILSYVIIIIFYIDCLKIV